MFSAASAEAISNVICQSDPPPSVHVPARGTDHRRIDASSRPRLLPRCFASLAELHCPVLCGYDRSAVERSSPCFFRAGCSLAFFVCDSPHHAVLLSVTPSAELITPRARGRLVRRGGQRTNAVRLISVSVASSGKIGGEPERVLRLV